MLGAVSGSLGEGHTHTQRERVGCGRVQGAEGCYYPCGSMGALCRWPQWVGRGAGQPAAPCHNVFEHGAGERELKRRCEGELN